MEDKVAIRFGDGVGLFGDTCGAITGAVTVSDAVHGCCRLPEDDDRKAFAKSTTQQLSIQTSFFRFLHILEIFLTKIQTPNINEFLSIDSLLSSRKRSSVKIWISVIRAGFFSYR